MTNERALDILVVDDDPSIGEVLCMHFDDEGYNAQAITTGAELKATLATAKPQLVILDQHLPDTTGINLVKWLKQEHSHIPCLMITGQHDMNLAIEAIKNGAQDYIHKPIDTLALDKAIKKILAPQGKSVLKADSQHETHDKAKLVGSSPAMLSVGKTIAIAAQNDANVLITGPSGTGKELVAKAIHNHSERTGAFVAINCSAIVENLLESELFGHEKGAFTGADHKRMGQIEAAAGGTLFLDEIGDMSPALQAKLLRVLQERTFTPVGSNEEKKNEARIIAATHQNISERIKNGLFRADLFYRLQVISIHLPALRDRMEDLNSLTEHLLNHICYKLGTPSKGLTKAALKKLHSHHWPGNIRELENTLTRAVSRSQRSILDAEDIELQKSVPQADTQKAYLSLEDMEKQYILEVYEDTGRHKVNTCDILGISRPSLDRRLKKWGVD